MKQIIDGKRYDTEFSKLLASKKKTYYMNAEYKKQMEYRNAYDAAKSAWTYLCKCVCKSVKKYAAAKIAYVAAKKHLASTAIAKAEGKL